MVPAAVVLFIAPAEDKLRPLMVCVVAVVRVKAAVVNLIPFVVPAAAEEAVMDPPITSRPLVVPPAFVAVKVPTVTCRPSLKIVPPLTPLVAAGVLRFMPDQLIVPAAVPVLMALAVDKLMPFTVWVVAVVRAR